MTKFAGVFTVGDSKRGASLIVWAIAEDRKIAEDQSVSASRKICKAVSEVKRDWLRPRRCLSLLQLLEAAGPVTANSPAVLTPPIPPVGPFRCARRGAQFAVPPAKSVGAASSPSVDICLSPLVDTLSHRK